MTNVTYIDIICVGFPYSKLVNKILYLQVLDYDRFSRDDPIGEVCLPLSDVNLANGETLWRDLQPCKGHAVSLIKSSRCNRQPCKGHMVSLVNSSLAKPSAM